MGAANTLYAFGDCRSLDSLPSARCEGKMPAVNVGLLDGQLAWWQYDGGHTDAPNMKYFIAWADRFIERAPSAH